MTSNASIQNPVQGRTKPENIGQSRHQQDAALPPDHFQALYLHLPFCFHKCHYCDFFSVVTHRQPKENNDDPQHAFTQALLAELNHWANGQGQIGDQTASPSSQPLRPTTLFAGGGTPTYLRPELWAQLLDALHQHQVLDHAAEFTVEANPETVTPELMQQLAQGGVNRVSIGAQSFNRQSLDALERWHDPDSVPRAVDACRQAGLHNFSLDLIFAIPGQTLQQLDQDLNQLLALQPKHLSVYGLTYEPQTPLTARLRVGQVTPIDEDTERAMYDHIMTRLDDAGFHHYELSNWAKRPSTEDPHTDHRCQHNLHYWHNRNWLGLGPGAASHIDGHRWKNKPNLPDYLAQSPTPTRIDQEHLPQPQRLGEQLMLRLRLAQGIENAWLEQHVPTDDPTHAARHDMIQQALSLQLMEQTNTHLRLTRAGRFVADTILARLL